MAIQRKTVVDQIEINRNGSISVRLCLLLVDGATEIGSKFHRTVIDNSVTPEDQLAFVNQHLSEMGEKPVSADDIARIANYCTLAGHKFEPPVGYPDPAAVIEPQE